MLRLLSPHGSASGCAALTRCLSAVAPRKVSLDAIKALRARSGAPMAMVKDALVAEGGDVDAAADRLRRDGARLASLRTGRAAQEGLVGVARDASARVAALVELQCETDFVARTAVFHDALAAVAQAALDRGAGAAGGELAAEELMAAGANGAVLANAAAVLGERVCIGRVRVVRGDCVGVYVHGAVPWHEDAAPSGVVAGRIGVAVAMDGAAGGRVAAATADRIALHVAAEAPQFLRRADVPDEVLRKEGEILLEAARAEEVKPGGKPRPEKILDQIVKGRLNKWLADVALEQQIMLVAEDGASAAKPATVGEWLRRTEEGAELKSFARIAI